MINPSAFFQNQPSCQTALLKYLLRSYLALASVSITEMRWANFVRFSIPHMLTESPHWRLRAANGFGRTELVFGCAHTIGLRFQLPMECTTTQRICRGKHMATKPTFTDILRLQTSYYALAIFGVAALNACSAGDDNRESASSDMGTMGCPKVCYLSSDTFSEALQQPCSAVEDCPANQVCLAPPNAEEPIRQCSGDVLAFRPCASGEDCTTDEVCRNSVCLTTCALASSCADGLDCVSVTGSTCDVGTQALVSEPVIDAGLDETAIDAEVDMATPDEIVPSCFVDNAVFETRFDGEPVAGLDNVWIGFDINADNRSEPVTRETRNADSRFVVWEGMPPTEVTSLTAENLTNAEFMPNRWPNPPNYGVFDFDDKKAVYVVGRIGDDLVIRFFDIDTASSPRDINLGRDVESYKVLLHGKAPTVLVHRSDKKCSIFARARRSGPKCRSMNRMAATVDSCLPGIPMASAIRSMSFGMVAGGWSCFPLKGQVDKLASIED